MKLGDLHAAFFFLDDNDFVFSESFDDVMSYRGYYDQVAFEPGSGVSLRKVKELIMCAFEDEFEGYKGGEYRYDVDTTAHLAHYGNCSDQDEENLEALVGRMLVEYNTAKRVDQNSKNGYNTNTKTATKGKKMARETKAQRLEREAAEQAVYNAERAATYQHRLMAMLERATKFNFELRVESGRFVLEDRNADDAGCKYELSLEHNEDNEEVLNDLSWRVELKEEQQRERERKYQLRQAALAKLTKEEREELGL